MAKPHDSPSPPSSRPVTSTTLLQGLDAMDPDAWARFVRAYGPVVFRWCRTDGLGEDDAADVGQEVFRAVMSSIGTFQRCQNGSFLGWLRSITKFKVADHFRRSGKAPQAVGGTDFLSFVQSISDDSTERCPEVEQQVDDQRLVSLQVLNELQSHFSPQAWSAFWETAVNGRTAADVAGDLSMSDMAVRKAKSRVLRKLKTELAELLLWEPAE
ncbi:MAG: sigma-70 family RNA polymerase sigma factor [Pirellulaceae bacterium]